MIWELWKIDFVHTFIYHLNPDVLRVDEVDPAVEHYFLPPQCRHPACVGE